MTDTIFWIILAVLISSLFTIWWRFFRYRKMCLVQIDSKGPRTLTGRIQAGVLCENCGCYITDSGSVCVEYKGEGVYCLECAKNHNYTGEINGRSTFHS